MNITQIEKNLLKFKALNACTECDLLGVDLAGVDLSGANLTEANLSDAKLKNAPIEGAIFCNTKTPWGLDNSGCEKE
jgi:uncharacterized protein YjbI with pentapeptide repeats